MDNIKNKGIGDHLVMLLLGLLIGFYHFGFSWFGIKAWFTSVTLYMLYILIKLWIFRKHN